MKEELTALCRWGWDFLREVLEDDILVSYRGRGARMQG